MAKNLKRLKKQIEREHGKQEAAKYLLFILVYTQWEMFQSIGIKGASYELNADLVFQNSNCGNIVDGGTVRKS